MKPKKLQVYKPKRLLDPKYSPFLPKTEGNTKWVAVPDKFAGRKIYVKFNDQTMIIRDWRAEAKAFRRFRDKFWEVGSKRPQQYTLGYFPFVPNTDEKY